MSMFGLGRPQPSSAEKIAAAEQEMDLITDMFNKYVCHVQASPLLWLTALSCAKCEASDSPNPA
jgi:hypothetical protein